MVKRGQRGGAAFLLVTLMTAGFISACESPSTAGMGNTGGSSAGGGGGMGGGGGASGGGAGGDSGRSCSATPSGCLCSADSSPSALAACSATSVATTAGAQGACCEGAFFCTCSAYACRNDPAQEYCACGLDYTVTTAIPNGAVVAQCPAPTATMKCCRSADSGLCSCLTAECEGGTTEVSACTLAMVAVCKEGEASIAACK